ncbi:MAG: hypothetical protein Q9159_007056 [Coniocarpon cinnabarinum]
MNESSGTYTSCVTDVNRESITVDANELSAFRQAIVDANLAITPIGLEGRYHSPHNGRFAFDLKLLCSMDQRFRLPDASELKSPLRSNTDAKVIAEGNLSDIAVDSILCDCSNWYDVIEATVKSSETFDIRILQVGGTGTFPRSLARLHPNVSVETTNTIKHAPSVVEPYKQVLPSLTSPRTEQSSRQTLEKPSREPIAVIGVACRYPQSMAVADFWDLIANGECAVQPFANERFDFSQSPRQPKGQFFGAFLDSPGAFDHRFFGISGREAKSMDPQQRLVLQLVYETLESGGYAERKHTSGQNIGCYMGVGSVDYEANVASDHANAFSATGTLRAFISGKASHYFGWTGPSLTFDTACSSSAVAINSACQALQLGECSMAVAGGVNIITAPYLYQNLAAASFLSTDGPSRAFDIDANGYCRGEGSGIVLLKPLKNALASNDFVLGVIRGSAVNQGSNCSPITVPHSDSQSSLYSQVLRQANLDPADVSFVEAHGTGTPVGDPIEVESIRRTFGRTLRTNSLALGSVKDNIGHAEAASGAAGLIKVLMMVHYRMIPKQANFKTLNPKIPPIDSDHMVIPSSTEKWSVKKRVAMVNNYGAAGSNAALLVQEHETAAGAHDSLNGHALPFALSANSEASLQAHARALLNYLRKTSQSDTLDNLPNVAFNLACRYNPDLRLSRHFLSSTHEALFAHLDEVAVRGDGVVKPDVVPPCIMCFGGQTGIVESLGLETMIPAIFSQGDVDDLVLLHCRLFAIQYASAKAWMSCGVKPDALIGHSFGQVTALCVGGALSLSDAMKFISKRAKLIQEDWKDDSGAMLSMEGTLSEVHETLHKAEQRHPIASTEIVCYNGPTSYVVAGTTGAIDAVQETVSTSQDEHSISLKRLANSHAYHSKLTEGILPGLQTVADSLSLKSPDVHIETCSESVSWPCIEAEKLVQHTRQPVYFQAAVERLSRKYGAEMIWLEAGSNSPIIPMVKRVVTGASSSTFLPISLSGPKAIESLSETSYKLRDLGIKMPFWPFHRLQTQSFRWLPLPPYQFEKSTHWIDLEMSKADLSRPSSKEPEPSELIYVVKREAGDVTTLAVNTEHDFYRNCVKGHSVLSQPLCPASMYCELAMKAVTLVVKGDGPLIGTLCLEQLQILNPLTLGAAGAVLLEIKRGPAKGNWTFTVLTKPTALESGPSVHATGSIHTAADRSVEMTFQSFERLVSATSLKQISTAAQAETLSGQIVYKVFGRTVEYAPYYQGVRKVIAKDSEVLGEVLIPSEQPKAMADSICNPVALDNFLQVAGLHINCLSPCQEDEVFVCVGIDNVAFRNTHQTSLKQQHAWTVYSNSRATQKGRVTSDIYVLDAGTQEVVVIYLGARFAAVSLKSLAKTLSKLNSAEVHANHTDDIEPLKASKPTAAQQLKTVNLPATPPDSGAESSNEGDEGSVEGTRTAGDINDQVRELIASILEMPLGDVQISSSMTELGIDSLMSTDISADISKSFHCDIPSADIASMSDLSDLCARIGQSTSPAKNVKQESASKRKSVKNSTSMAVTQDRVVTPPDTPDEGLFSTAATSLLDCKDRYDRVVDEAGLRGFSSEVYPCQANLVLAYILEAFSAVGCDLAAVPTGTTIPSLKFAAKHQQAVGQYYAALEEGKIIDRCADGSFVRTDTPLPQEESTRLSEEIIERFPKHASEHKLLHTTGAHLADCLTELKDPISLLFRDAKARDLLQDVYTNAPMFKAGTIFLAQYLQNVLDSANLPRPVRILELGAGTGGTTSYLLSKLVKSTQKFQYTFTDLSPSLVAAAKKKFSEYSFMEYGVVDIEKSQPANMLKSFDVVISTNCIHATRNLVNSCTNINAVLRDDGILCLVELTQNLFWFDLVFGLLEGWWLFNDGRKHALASPTIWDKSLRASGFNWVDWTQGQSEESKILRVIVASPSKTPAMPLEASVSKALDGQRSPVVKETQTFKEVDGLSLQADIHYPSNLEAISARPRPIALMVHGGGHIMLSRNDLRAKQMSYLLKSGFLPISIDYRLCPEVTLPEGPMNDVRDALAWIRQRLPAIELRRRDVRIDSSTVVAVGWSTGGHLAMTLAWTSSEINITPPQAILAFYCPTDYESSFWLQPNVPRGSERAAEELDLKSEELIQGVGDSPIVAYNPSPQTKPVGGWMAPSDARSRIALWMNWRGRHLHLLLHGVTKKRVPPSDANGELALPSPTEAQIRAVSPLAQIKGGHYRTPTFIVHGTRDDLIPWEQSQATHDALVACGVEADCRIVQDAVHLFDIEPGWQAVAAQDKAVWDGYDFLRSHAGL